MAGPPRLKLSRQIPLGGGEVIIIGHADDGIDQRSFHVCFCGFDVGFELGSGRVIRLQESTERVLCGANSHASDVAIVPATDGFQELFSLLRVAEKWLFGFAHEISMEEGKGGAD